MNLDETTVHIATFAQAVKHVAALAHARLPEALHGQLERATALVLNRHVWMDDEGKHAQVLSSDGRTWYPANGHCTCMDATRAEGGWCKHRLGVALYRRASELLAQSHGVAAAPAAAAPALPEAPASANARVVIDGHEVQLTLRDVDEERLLLRLAALLARYPAAACPGKGSTGEQPEVWCPVHAVPMTKQSNQRGSWWSHKAPDGSWCRGKAPRG